MSQLKQLASQTIWYGLSSIAARFLGYLQTPILTYLLTSRSGQLQYGEVSLLYAVIPFANVLFTYGMETAYFRFSNKENASPELYNTALSALLISTLALSLLMVVFRAPLAAFLEFPLHPEYITYTAVIIGLDALTAIPFARLRQENRPRKYAFVKVAGIVVNLSLIILLVGVCPRLVARYPDSAFATWYNGTTKTALILLANVVQNVVTMLLLAAEWRALRLRIDRPLLSKMLAYASPFIIIGLGGMVNETLDRVLLQKRFSGTAAEAKIATGIYSANYKLAIFITLFIQAFRMAAEPFFFRQAAGKDAPATYARVMKWFVITLCLAFLSTALFLDIWKYINGAAYRSGIGVVPILLWANVALGIYYNLSVWYKVTDRLGYGVAITLIGAALTLVLNWYFVPIYGMYACAWATAICYTVMMLLSYAWGQRFYPVPYALRTIGCYLGLMLLLYGAHHLAAQYLDAAWLRISLGAALMMVFVGYVFRAEQGEIRALRRRKS